MRPSQYESLSARVRLFLAAVDALGAVGAAPLRLCRCLRPRPLGEPRKFLLTRCDGIGDLVLSIPAIRAMRKRFPTAEMHLMVGPWAREAAEMIPGPDRVIVHAPWGYRVLRAKREDWSLTPDFQMLRDMRRERYDLAVDLRGDLLTLLPMAFWGIPERVARATRGGRFALTRVVPPAPAGHEHETQRTLDVAAAVGASSPDCDVRVKVPPEAVKTAQCLLESTGLRPEKTVLFSPGAQSPIKRWPDANFGALARTLRADGLQAAVVGSSGDAGMAQEIVRTGEGVVDLTGKTNLKELTALFSLCSAFVAVDSGPAHLAAAVGASGAALFGPGDPARFRPLSGRVRVIQRPCPLQPCLDRAACRQPDRRCMAQITPDEVYEALKPILVAFSPAPH